MSDSAMVFVIKRKSDIGGLDYISCGHILKTTTNHILIGVIRFDPLLTLGTLEVLVRQHICLENEDSTDKQHSSLLSLVHLTVRQYWQNT